MLTGPEKELAIAESYFKSLSSEKLRAGSVLEVINAVVEASFSLVRAKIDPSFELPESISQDTLLYKEIDQLARALKQRFLSDESGASSQIIGCILPFKDILLEAIRGNIILFLYRVADAFKEKAVPHIVFSKKPDQLLRELRTNLSQWHEQSCKGPSSHHHGKKGHNCHSYNHKREDEAHRHIEEKRALVASSLIKNVLLPEGSKSLYLPVSPLFAPFIASYIQQFIDNEASSYVEMAIEWIMSKKARLKILDAIARLNVRAAVHSCPTTEKNSRSIVSEEDIDVSVDEIKELIPLLFPDLWVRYFRYLPLRAYVYEAIVYIYDQASSEQSRDELTKFFLITLADALESIALSTDQRAFSLHSDQVVSRFEEWMQNPANFDAIVKVCMIGSQTSSIDPKAPLSLTSIEGAKNLGSFIASGVKSAVAKTASSGIRAALQWEDNAPLFARKSAHYFLSDAFESLILSFNI